MIPDKCLLCHNNLTFVQNGSIIIYQCRKKYIYLGKDNPICHYTFSHHNNWIEEKHPTQHRFVVYPFVALTFVKDNKSKILHLGNRNIEELCWAPAIYVNSDNYDYMLKKFNLYLLF